MIARAHPLKRLQRFAFSTQAGSLYTWGIYASGTGFSKDHSDPTLNVPQLLEPFKNNVVKVSTGRYHSAVITANGELHTYGDGRFGQLGTEISPKAIHEPQSVSFFKHKGLKVSDVLCGERHTLALTEDGQLWSWGFGGSYGNQVLDYFNARYGALGSGLRLNRTAPAIVEGIFERGKIKHLATGDQFAIAVTEKNEVYNWGDGVQGSFADGLDEPYLLPTLNTHFKELLEHDKLTIQKIKSASHFSVALFSDGKLYSWGRNNGGSLGTRQNEYIATDNVISLPTVVADSNYKGQKIVDFDVGENTLVILTDQNRVYWSGIGLAYKPELWNIPQDQKIVKIAASLDSFAALTDKGKLFIYNDFTEPYRDDNLYGYYESTHEIFQSGKVIDIGGQYGTRYAIVKE